MHKMLATYCGTDCTILEKGQFVFGAMMPPHSFSSQSQDSYWEITAETQKYALNVNTETL